MEELSEYVQDELLGFQDTYSTGNPQPYITDNTVTLIYNTTRSEEMCISIQDSIALANRICERNLILSHIVCSENALIIEFTL